MPLYAIGDIHGQRLMLDQALELIFEDGGPEAEIVFVGDYTDRGPDSRGVLDRLIEGRNAGLPWRFLKGNHDRMFHDYIVMGQEHDANVSSGLSWMNPRLGGTTTLASYGLGGSPQFLRDVNGGHETLASYGVDAAPLGPQETVSAARQAVPDAHVQFLATLPLSYRTEQLFFCHAGVRPGVPLDEQTEDDLIWIRKPFHEHQGSFGPLIVHGHTPVDGIQHFGNRVDIDTGAGYGHPLIPTVFEGRECFALTDAGRAAITPPGDADFSR